MSGLVLTDTNRKLTRDHRITYSRFLYIQMSVFSAVELTTQIADFLPRLLIPVQNKTEFITCKTATGVVYCSPSAFDLLPVFSVIFCWKNIFIMVYRLRDIYAAK